jgi:hypothetical protein
MKVFSLVGLFALFMSPPAGAGAKGRCDYAVVVHHTDVERTAYWLATEGRPNRCTLRSVASRTGSQWRSNRPRVVRT